MMLYQIVEIIKANPGWSLIILLSLIQITPIKINPWSWLLSKLGSWLFGGIYDRLDDLENRMKKQEEEEAERNARSARRSILRAADEIYSGKKHSKEYFEEILAYCNEYDIYCNDHPAFLNGKTHAAEKRIKDIYMKCLETHNFL